MIPDAIRRFVAPAPEMQPWSLRFLDPERERRFQSAYFRDNLPYIRVAHVFGIATWILFGVFALFVLDEDVPEDAVIRYGIEIPIVIVSLALTYRRGFERIWKPQFAIVLLITGVIWATYRVFVEEARPDWGYAGLMVILIFLFTFSRLPWIWAAVVGALMIVSANVVMVGFLDEPSDELLFGNFFPISTAVIGCAVCFGIERVLRLLFLREQELDHARERADHLLRNILPDAIVDRLKERDVALDAEYIAEGHDEVTVLFVDLVGFTQQTGRSSPAEMVAALDAVFTGFDELADRFGMEKIKTVGDAYMAVAGAPEPRGDDAAAAAEMALAAIESLREARWPSGDAIGVRVGIASGPAVAGVIGRRKFAYDLWGDTVNTASRLESNGTPGCIQVSESVFERLRDRFAFSERHVIDLKGKGPTPAYFLEGRRTR